MERNEGAWAAGGQQQGGSPRGQSGERGDEAGLSHWAGAQGGRGTQGLEEAVQATN